MQLYILLHISIAALFHGFLLCSYWMYVYKEFEILYQNLRGWKANYNIFCIISQEKIKEAAT